MEVDTIKTVFQTEWIGGGALSNMIRQYGLAERALKSLQTTSSAGLPKGAFDIGKSLNLDAFSKFNRGIMKEVEAGNVSLEKAQQASNAYGEALGLVSTSSAGATSSLAGLAAGAAATGLAIAGLAVAAKKTWEVLGEGAEIAQLDQSFNRLVTTMTDAPDVLNEMKEASRGTLTTMAAQEGFMTLVAGSSQEMTQALADAAPKILEISKAANKLNPALGDTNFMFTSLAKGIKRAEPRLIDNLGLKLRVADANRALAEQLGKSVMELTAEEKQLAILNETLRAGDLLIKQVGGSVDALNDPFQQLTTSAEDFKNTFKETLFLSFDVSPVGGFIAEGLAGIAEADRRRATILMAAREGLISSTAAHNYEIKRATGSVKEEIAYYNVLAGEIQRARDAAKEKAEAEAEAVALAVEQGRITKEGWLERERYRKSLLKPGTNMLGDFDVLSGLETSGYASALKVATEKQKELARESAKEWQKWADSVNDASEKARDAWLEYNAGLGDLAEKHLEADAASSLFTASVQDIGDSFVNIGGPTKEQKELIDELQEKYDKAAKNVKDMQTGVKYLGDDQEKANKSIEKATKEMEHYKAALEQVNVADDEWVRRTTVAQWNWKNVETAIYDAAKAADLGADDFLQLALDMGKTDEASAEAALMGAAFESKLNRTLEQVKLGKIPASKVDEIMKDFANEIMTYDLSILLEPNFGLRTGADPYADLMGGMEEHKIYADIERQDERDSLMETLFGAEANEPLVFEAGLNTDPLTDEITYWMTQNGTLVFTGVVDGIALPPGTTPQAGGRGGTGGEPEFASGGYTIGNSPIIVGEQGPELWTPPGNGTIMPNGAGGNITIYNYNKDAAAIAMAAISMRRRGGIGAFRGA